MILVLQRSLKLIKQSELTKEQYTIGEVAALNMSLAIENLDFGKKKSKTSKYKKDEKYNEIKKLNTHTSASYVIARRGMRFKDAA